MEGQSSAFVVKSNLDNLQMVARTCERKCIGRFTEAQLDTKEQGCLTNCVKKYFKFIEIPKKVYQLDTVQKNLKTQNLPPR